ncbi:magnesium/cobalt transporter CorA [Salibacter sp.]|uniref:magnesium/cobalt transporter CorA n=1 Tax=Salibacter sp. TaxID=2010995 RepID=UPI002870A4DF|nr:magnesium/cobalt transporter CorA [Salibacter sp.]MDR9399108.1 magnesium/cobalt transporter CorA [Salibacter sp.]MDR9488115.1 magnesium/cobalt transporter CorA [Salibacter sp.]
MIVCHYYSENELLLTRDFSKLEELQVNEILWVDLVKPSYKEREYVQSKFDIELLTAQEAEEIESSSKFSETEDEINANSNFIIKTNDGYKNEAVSFIIKDDFIITQRKVELKTFDDIHKKLPRYRRTNAPNYKIFLILFETRIDFDADFLEHISREISDIGKDLALNRNLDDDMLIKISNFQETTMLIRENIVDKQRIISSILKSQMFPDNEYDRIRIMIKDVGSLLDHTSFNFERLEYLQNTFLGLVDLEQNEIIKIFTVVTVIAMPPTLIASLYGMNFQFMPELDEIWGYPFAIALMILSSGLTLFYFKRKGWL